MVHKSAVQTSLSGDSVALGNYPELLKPENLKQYYFINEVVEWSLTRYIWTGCTDILLRDDVMQHANELIFQIIRKQRLHIIYPGQEESSFSDLTQTAWVQIEKTLYKYRAKPHCRACYNYERPSDSSLYNPGSSEYGIITLEYLHDILDIKKCLKCGADLCMPDLIQPQQGIFGGTRGVLFKGLSKVFNMWSQIARTVCLAHIKKEGRDRRNCHIYKDHLDNRHRFDNDSIHRFLSEARQICQYNPEHCKILDALEHLLKNDEKPYDGLVAKLTEHAGVARPHVSAFLKLLRLRSHEFTDSPFNKSSGNSGRSDSPVDDEDD